MQKLLIENINSSELEEIIVKAVNNAVKNLSIGMPVASSSPTSDRLLTKKEAAAYLKISLPTLTKYIKAGYVKAHTVAGSRMRFKASDLEKALKGLRGR